MRTKRHVLAAAQMMAGPSFKVQNKEAHGRWKLGTKKVLAKLALLNQGRVAQSTQQQAGEDCQAGEGISVA